MKMYSREELMNTKNFGDEDADEDDDEDSDEDANFRSNLVCWFIDQVLNW